MRQFLFVLAVLGLQVGIAKAQSETMIQSDVMIGIDEQLGNFLPSDIELTDIEGNKVQLASLLDKPTILNFVYYRCPGICTPLMDAIAEVDYH
jgi:protein SCO1